MAIGEVIIWIAQIRVEYVHKFKGILLTLGFDVQLSELIIEMHIDIFVGGTVNEITRHSKLLISNQLVNNPLFYSQMKKHKIREDLIIIEEVESKMDQSYDHSFKNQMQNYNPENMQCQINSFDHKNHESTLNQEQNHLCRHKQERTKPLSQSYCFSTNLSLSPKANNSAINSLGISTIGKPNYNSYHDLTLKLQNAFNKITTSRKTLSKSTSHVNDIWKRSQISLQKKQRQTQRKLQQKQRQIFKQYRDRPSIDKKSALITKVNGHQPIHIRCEKLVQQKKLKTEYQKQLKQKQEMKQQFAMQQKYRKQQRTTRTYTQYYTQMIRWKERAQEKNKLRLQAQKIKQIGSATFKPLINQNSNTMMIQQYRLPIDQRGLIKKKTSQDYSYSYIPTITKRKVCK